MNKKVEKRLNNIRAIEPDEFDKRLLHDIGEREKAEESSEPISLEAFEADMKTEQEFSGKILLRLPKSLHKELAKAAKKEDVSLNQYALYKLAK